MCLFFINYSSPKISAVTAVAKVYARFSWVTGNVFLRFGGVYIWCTGLRFVQGQNTAAMKKWRTRARPAVSGFFNAPTLEGYTVYTWIPGLGPVTSSGAFRLFLLARLRTQTPLGWGNTVAINTFIACC